MDIINNNHSNTFFRSIKSMENEKVMLDLYYDLKTELATRTKLSVKESPAVIAIFTEEEIKASGARDLTDVLNLMPGIHLTLSSMGGTPIVNMRGIGTDGSEKVFFMIDGHPVNQELTGGGTFHFADMPVDNIKQVELLRGTGSSLYGANAFVGVINIVTRKAEDINGASTSLKYGSFDSKTLYLEAGKESGNKSLWGNVNYYNTNGADIFIQKDALNQNSFSPNAKISNAPGNTNEWLERTDLAFGAKFNQFTLQGQVIDKKHGGFFNTSGALNDNTNIDRKFYYGNLKYKDSFFSDLLNVNANVFFNQYDYTGDLYLQPPGFVNSSNVIFPLGRRSLQSLTIEDYGARFQGDINLQSHLISMGFDAKNTRMFDIKHVANYNPKQLSEMTDVSEDFNWMEPADRFFYGIFLQDQWTFHPKTTLQAGMRYDHYDDKSGGSISPNLSLLYNLSDSLRAKLIYGEAFRAPAFRELYKQAAGSPRVGNSDLKPEKATTYQAGIEWQANDSFDMSFYGFISEYEELLREVWNPYKKVYMFQNVGEVDVHGAELSLKYIFLKNRPLSRIFLNISYTQTEDGDGYELAASPEWVISSGIDWDITKNTHFNLNTHYVSSSETLPDDPRDVFPSYWLTNMSLTLKDMMGNKKNMDLRGSIYNLFDVDYALPNLNNNIPENYIRSGITFELALTYRF